MERSGAMTAEQPRIDREVRVQVERLVEEDHGQHSHEEIERLALETEAELADAPIQQYVPNLVYKEVKNRLVEDGVREAPESARADRG
jgi:hypothetical protein